MLARKAIGRPHVAALLVAACSAPRAARAVEREHHVGAGGGLSVLVIDDKSTASVGGGGWLGYSYGLSDAFNLVAEAQHSVVALDETRGADVPTTRPAQVSNAGVGVAYVIDILQWVPHIAAIGGGTLMQGGTLDSPLLLPSVQLGAGIDYKWSRTFSVGLIYRQTVPFTKLETYPSFSNVFLRAEIAWGF